MRDPVPCGSCSSARLGWCVVSTLSCISVESCVRYNVASLQGLADSDRRIESNEWTGTYTFAHILVVPTGSFKALRTRSRSTTVEYFTLLEHALQPCIRRLCDGTRLHSLSTFRCSKFHRRETGYNCVRLHSEIMRKMLTLGCSGDTDRDRPVRSTTLVCAR